MIIDPSQVDDPVNFGSGSWVSISATVGSGTANCPQDSLPAVNDTLRVVPPAATPPAPPPFDAEVATYPRDDIACAPLPVSCVFGPWSLWALCQGTCSPTVATTSTRSRTRSILTAASNGGIDCDISLLNETVACSIPRCGANVSCLLTTWTSWSLCASDLSGNTTRQRDVVTQPYGSGAPCGSLLDVTECTSALLQTPQGSSAQIDLAIATLILGGMLALV